MCSVGRKQVDSFLRHTVEQREPRSTHSPTCFPEQVGPSSGLCPGDFELCLRARVGSVARCVRMRSEHAASGRGGAPLNNGHHSLVAAFPSNRKNIPRTGNLLCWQTLASSCVANMTMRSIEILQCRAAHKDQPCASVLCPLGNIY